MMRSRGPRQSKVPEFTWALAFAFLAAVRALPAETKALSAESPSLASQPFIVAVARFESINISSDHDLFLSALPRLMAAGLKSLPPHFETDGYSAERKARTRILSNFVLGADLAQRLDDLSLRSLEPGIEKLRRVQNIDEAAAKVTASRKKLEEALEDTQAGPLPSAPPKPRVAQLLESNARGELIELGASTAAVAAKASKADLLITGRVEEIGGYVSVSIAGWDAALGRVVFAWKEYASPDDPEPLARMLADRIAQEIAGRDFARVDLSIDPASATVSLDGEAIQEGTRCLYFFEPSQVRLEAKAPSRKALRVDLVLALGDRKGLAVSLPIDEEGTITVTTSPSGLPVFLDGAPLGNSPLIAALGSSRAVVTAFDEKGGRAEAVVAPGGAREIILEPRADSAQDAARVSDARRAFYDSLGWFLLALPPFSISYGLNLICNEAAARYTTATTLTTGSLAAAYQVSTVSTATLAVAAAGLATNAVLHFITYLKAAR